MTTTTRLVIISATVTAVTSKMLPLLAGNLPRMIQYCVPWSATRSFVRARPASASEILTYSAGQALEEEKIAAENPGAGLGGKIQDQIRLMR